MTAKPCRRIIVRPALEADVPMLATMASEFKDYLDTLDEPGDAPEPTALTAETFRRDGFGDSPQDNWIIGDRDNWGQYIIR